MGTFLDDCDKAGRREPLYVPLVGNCSINLVRHPYTITQTFYMTPPFGYTRSLCGNGSRQKSPFAISIHRSQIFVLIMVLALALVMVLPSTPMYPELRGINPQEPPKAVKNSTARKDMTPDANLFKARPLTCAALANALAQNTTVTAHATYAGAALAAEVIVPAIEEINKIAGDRMIELFDQVGPIGELFQVMQRGDAVH
jgi:hypothetical protein